MKTYFLLFGTISILLFSCGKEEGIGGKNTIQGTVVQEIYDENTLINSYPVPEKDVYIIYGDQGYFADLVKTNFDGTFRFENLHKGKYQLFTYSECDNCAAGTEPVFLNVELLNKKEDVITDTLFIKKFD